jgi:hypothetical protein
MRWLPLTLAGAGALATWETAWWARRRHLRGQQFACAKAEAPKLGKPLVVVGAPDGGVTAGYGCGDVTVDLGESTCPNFIRADITKPLPFADDSVVVFVACVLEYVSDFQAAMTELRRIAGRHLYIVRVEPWTLAGWFYPGARRRLSAAEATTCGLQDWAEGNRYVT